MGADSKIEWTDHTMNFWVGCTEVSRACDHCYAKSWAKRSGHPELWEGGRRRTSASLWQQPIKWNRKAEAEGKRYRVFTNSLADFFDNQVPGRWRDDAWHRIAQTPHLDWMILTKRPQNIAKMLPTEAIGCKPWGAGWPNVWLGTTVEDQAEADRRLPYLLGNRAAIHFVSYEPALGPVSFNNIANSQIIIDALRGESWEWRAEGVRHNLQRHLSRLNLVICGGESGPHARPMHPDWAASARDQCNAAGVAFHFKQWGEWAPGECADFPATRTERTATWGGDQWGFGSLTPRESEETHRDDEPDLFRIGKARAGRLLDGVEHNAMPEVTR